MAKAVEMQSESAPERLIALFARCALEPDPERARRLAEQYAEAFVEACTTAWGARLAAGTAILDAAEQLLDEAAMASDPRERQYLIRLADVLITSATARP